MIDPLGDDDHSDADERARVVAWLRARADRRLCGSGYGSIADAALRRAAEAIEAGDHYREDIDP